MLVRTLLLYCFAGLLIWQNIPFSCDACCESEPLPLQTKQIQLRTLAQTNTPQPSERHEHITMCLCCGAGVVLPERKTLRPLTLQVLQKHTLFTQQIYRFLPSKGLFRPPQS